MPPETTAGERTVRAGHLVFASGQIASDDRAGVPSEVRIDPAFPYYGSAIKRQTRYILDKLGKKFVDAGTSLDHVVKAHVFHTDLHNFDAFDEVWREFFPKTPPCRATVGTAGLLVPGCFVAVDLIATLPSSPGKVFSSTAPRAPVSYSEAIAVGDLVFASCLMASDYKTGVPPEANVDPAFPYYGSEIKRQTRYILNNFRTVLAASGTQLGLKHGKHVDFNLIKDFKGYDKSGKEFFSTPPPRSTIGVPDLLVRDALVEIDLITAVPSVLREFVDVPDIPKPLANYAPALRVGNLVFAAGAPPPISDWSGTARVSIQAFRTMARRSSWRPIYSRQPCKNIRAADFADRAVKHRCSSLTLLTSRIDEPAIFSRFSTTHHRAHDRALDQGPLSRSTAAALPDDARVRANEIRKAR